MKALVSLAFLAKEHHETALRKKDNVAHVSWTASIMQPLKTALLTRRIELAALLVPSILYAGQNNLLVGMIGLLYGSVKVLTPTHRTNTVTLASNAFLSQYVALSNLPASIYQVTYQLKILTTAIFSVLFFRRSYSPWKWFALLLLTAGVAVVQMPSGSDNIPDAGNDGQAQDPLVGFSAIVLASISSAIAGCYFE